ncbi:MAG: polysaccharide deacetylase family protein [Lachnospiraceae bacterium]
MWIILGLIVLSISLLWLLYGIVPTYYYKVKAASERKEEEFKHLYLSFDDGVDRIYTQQLLDLLKRYQIHVTFFVVARYAQENPLIIQRIKKEGHCIALHSLAHESALLKTPLGIKRELEESIAIMESLGVKVTLYRPPWGHCNLSLIHQLKKHNIKLVLWNVMAQDWKGDLTADRIAQRLQSRTGSGDTICLHDGRGTNGAPGRTIQALTTMLALWSAQGYSFLRMDERYE